MGFLAQIVITLGIIGATALGAVNSPAKWFGFEPPKFGVSLTTLTGTEQLKNFPTTYNANLNALNNGKIEVGSTSIAAITTLANLATVGTIGSGVWNGTAVTVPFGGTGSTTLSSNQVLLGNGTSLMKTVAGFGTAGQFLTSNGVGAAPSWQTSSLNQSDNYTWTGYHSFAFASTTVLEIDGAGAGILKTISNESVKVAAPDIDYASPTVVLKDHTNASVSMTSAGTTYVIRYERGLNTFTPTTTSMFIIRANMRTDSSANTETMSLNIGNGSATTTAVQIVQTSSYANAFCEVKIFLKNSLSSWDWSGECFAENTGVFLTANGSSGAPSSVDLTNGFDIELTAVNNTQNSRTGASDYVNITRAQ